MKQTETQTYGYVRVSSRDQNEARQLLAMRQFGVAEERMYAGYCPNHEDV